ncbi:NAD(P)H-dependent flavin oxidoreductase [Dawidia soli]|uniref:Nitronate monooxygenase n=1 Tax=Dawidia soli TaxID=2782352 RepID=A0AAP2GBK1_9BACT|nr:nitronate monooxygenase [Dawidia soli]MBT1685192.1 nitronate monooxygenase [Dawidia soli]
MNQRIQHLFNIEIPIVQAGMVWCSGWRLASAVSNAGGLGLIGAGSMYPQVLREHIQKCKAATTKPFGVNVPLLYPEIDALMKIIVEEQVPVVFTSAGNPATWTGFLKQAGITVVHVVSSVRFAQKAVQAGVDAVVAEGFEAGGHNGREETTTLVLIPMVRDAITVPLMAAGGIASGRAMLACEVLGADGFQVGSRFAVSEESSAHERFKQRVTTSAEGETVLTLKQLAPVRLIRNKFSEEVLAAERRGASVQELDTLLGKRRARLGIFEGDLDAGELEIGQVAAALRRVQPAGTIVHEMWQEYQKLRKHLYA